MSTRPGLYPRQRWAHPRRHHELPHPNHALLPIGDGRCVGNQLRIKRRRIVVRSNTPRVLETLDGRVLVHPYLVQVEAQRAYQVKEAGAVAVGDVDVVELLDNFGLVLELPCLEEKGPTALTISRRQARSSSCSSCCDKASVRGGPVHKLTTSGRGGQSTRPRAHASSWRTRSIV